MEEENDHSNDLVPYASISVVKKYLEQKNSLSVVDLGCGQGHFLSGLKDDKDLNFDLMKGVDLWKDETPNLNTNYISSFDRRVTSSLKIELIKEDVFVFISRDTNSYDLIIASNLIHFFDKEEIEAFIARCYALLKPGGVMYIKMINSDHRQSKSKKYKTIYNDDLKANIEKICPVREVIPLEKHVDIVIVR